MAQTQTQLKFISAISSASLTQTAMQDVIEQLAREPLEQVDLAIVFASADHVENFELIYVMLQEAIAPEHVVGMTAEGVIGVNRELQRQSGLVVLAASLPGAAVTPFSYDQLDWPMVLNHPESLCESLNPFENDLKAMLLLADPFSTPTVKLLPALNQAFPQVPVVGGMASAAREPGKNRLVIDGEILSEGAVGLTIAGDLDVQCTVSQGCRPIGKPFVITKAKRHLVQELGGRSAYQMVRETIESLDDEMRELVRNKGILLGRVLNEYKDRFGRGDFLIRNLVGYDEDAGYIAVNDTQVRVGQTVQFHVHDEQTAIEDFRLLLQGQSIHGPASGALLFSCNGRGVNLFKEPNQDATMVHEALGNMPLAGVFAAGEIGPINNTTYMHGHTASLMVFRPQLPDAE